MCAGKISLLPLLLGLVLLLQHCATVHSHGDLALNSNELLTTAKGWLVIVTAFVGLLVILLLSILGICCWYNQCKVAQLQQKPHGKIEEGGVKLTMIEKTDESWVGGGEVAGFGDVGTAESNVTTVCVELEGGNTLSTFGHQKKESSETTKDQAKEDSSEESKKGHETEEQGQATGDENKQKDGAEPKEGQGSASVLQAIPPPPPIMLDLSPAIWKQKSASSEPGTTDVKTTKVKPVKESSAPSIMLELSRAILKPKLTPTGASAAAEVKATKDTTASTKETTGTSEAAVSATETKASTDKKSDSSEVKKSEVVASLKEEATPKSTEQDTEKKAFPALMNFADIDLELGQALKDLGDF